MVHDPDAVRGFLAEHEHVLAARAKRDHHNYNAQLWLECREMAVKFFKEAQERLPGRCDDLFGRAAARYGTVCERLRALIELHPSRENSDWGPGSTFTSPEAAAIVREAAQADAEGLACLQRIVDVL